MQPQSVLERYGFRLLVAVVILAAVLRYTAFTSESLWIDEAASAFFAAQSWSYLWTDLPEVETNPPLYFMVLKAWTGLAGNSEVALRLPSTLASLGAVFLIGCAGRVVGGARFGWALGLMAAAICALWHFQIVHAANARGYSFATLGIASMLCGALVLIRGSEGGQAPVLRLGRLGDCVSLSYVALAVGSAMTLWSHLVGVVAVLIFWLFLIFWWAIRHRGHGGLFWSLLASGCAAIALFAPYVPNLMSFAFGAQGELSGIAWLEAPSPKALVVITLRAFGQDSLDLGNAAQLAVVAVTLGLGLVGLVRLLRLTTPEARWILGLVMAMTAGLWLVLVGLTYSVKPMLVPRTLIFAHPPLFLLLAAAPWAVPTGRGVVAAVLLAFLAIGAVRPLGEAIHDHRDYPLIVDTIAQSDAPDAPILIVPYYTEVGLIYYEQDRGVALNRHPYPEPYRLPNRPIPPLDAAGIDALLAGLEAEPTVWVLVRRFERYDPEGKLFQRLTAEGREQTVVLPGKRLDYDDTLYRFDLR